MLAVSSSWTSRGLCRVNAKLRALAFRCHAPRLAPPRHVQPRHAPSRFVPPRQFPSRPAPPRPVPSRPVRPPRPPVSPFIHLSVRPSGRDRPRRFITGAANPSGPSVRLAPFCPSVRLVRLALSSVCPSVCPPICPAALSAFEGRFSPRGAASPCVRPSGASVRPPRPSVCPFSFPFVRRSVRPSLSQGFCRVGLPVRPPVRSASPPRASVFPFVFCPPMRSSDRPSVRPSVSY